MRQKRMQRSGCAALGLEASRRQGSVVAAALRAGGRLGTACLALALCACGPPRHSVHGSPAEGVVFARLVDGVSDLSRARLSDGEIRSLTGTPGRAEEWPFWSSTAHLLIFQTRGAGERGTWRLTLLDPERGRETQLEAPGLDQQWPAWSRDGRHLVFAFRGGDPPAGLGRLSFPGGEARVIASSGAEDFFLRPRFSPDGLAVVAQRRGPGGVGSQLWVVEPGAEPRRLTTDPASFDLKASFTRDGRAVLFTRRGAPGTPRDVMLVDAKGGEPRAVASEPGSDDHSATPSPTRPEIAFVSNRDGNVDVFLADLDGGPARNLTRSAGRDEFAPHWSADGERLLLTAEPARAGRPAGNDRMDRERTVVVVVDRSGRVLFETPGMMPDWMPPWR